MSNERPDEFLSWRTKLTQPDALPEQGLDDPESAWQQLYTRLGEKPRRRLFYWYGAAACLLLALIPAALLFRDRPSSGKYPGSALRQASAIRPASLPKAAGSETTRPMSSPSSPGSVTSVTPSSDHRRSPELSARPTSIIRVTSPAGPATLESMTPPVPLSPGQGPQLAQQPTIKRTLRVVSINELDNPPVIEPVLALERSSVLFKVRLHPDKGLTRQVSADRGEDPEFLKLKISLQNP